jgi:hypothetical protein
VIMRDVTVAEIRPVAVSGARVTAMGRIWAPTPV